MTELEQLKQVYKDGFADDSDAYVDYFFSVIKKQNRFYLLENNRIISAAYVNPKNAILFGKMQKIAYLSAVSTLTEFRGQKKIAKVMSIVINKLYSRGYIFAALNPFDCCYYKQYGFRDVSFFSKIVASGNKKFDIRLVTKKDADIMAALEQAMFNKFDNYLTGSKKRVCAQFDEFAADGVNAYIISENAVPIAYFFDEGQEINCFATSDIRSFMECSAIAGKTVSNFFVKGESYVQMRIINAYKCLKEYDYSKTENMIKTVKITDNIISTNNICVKIVVKDGKATIDKADSGDFTVDIGMLTEKVFQKSQNLFVDKY